MTKPLPKQPPPPPQPPHQPPHHPVNLEERQYRLGLRLFIASLAVFFAACLAAYLIMRFSYNNPQDERLHLPFIFYVSTALLISISATLRRAVHLIRSEYLAASKKVLKASMALAALFVVIQGIGLFQLGETHFSFYQGEGKLYGISLSLIFIHALHVVGGMFALGYVLRGSHQGRYDHEFSWPVEVCASYWHFMDLVWIVFLATFVFAG